MIFGSSVEKSAVGAVNCSGDENSFDECSTLDAMSCSSQDDAGVVCQGL